MDENLAVEVEAVPIRLVLCDGRASEAKVFLHAVSSRHFGPETVGERLSRPAGRFLPCQTSQGLDLVNLDHVAYLECPHDLAEIAELDELASFRALASIELAHGEHLVGEVRYRLPAANCRMSDLLNAEERFFLLTQATHCYFVNRAAVVRLREVSPPPPELALVSNEWDLRALALVTPADGSPVEVLSCH